MNKFVYKIEQENQDLLSQLRINNSLPIEDNNGNKMIINKLLLEDSKLFFETTYLKVLNVSTNKLYLEIPKSHIDLFNYLDDKCVELLENLMLGKFDIDIDKIFESRDLNVNYEDITYKPIIDEKSNILSINVFTDTRIKQHGKIESLNNIKPNDYVGLVLGLDYISLLIDSKSLLARTKLYCYYIEIHKQYIYKQEPRETIDEWKFSSKLKSDNIFIKTNTTENDNFDVNTEIPEFLENKKMIEQKNDLKLYNVVEEVNSDLEIESTFNSVINSEQNNNDKVKDSITSNSENKNILNYEMDSEKNIESFNNLTNNINNSDSEPNLLSHILNNEEQNLKELDKHDVEKSKKNNKQEKKTKTIKTKKLPKDNNQKTKK